MSPSVDGATVIGIAGGAAPIPNAWACARILSSPSWAPSSAKAVLHERASASRSEAVAPVPQAVPAKFSSFVAVSCSVISDAAVSWLSGV